MKARKLWINLMLLMSIALAAAPDAAALSPTAPAALALASFDQDAPKASIDINVTTSNRGGDWYKNPIIIGGGVIILVLLVALASRGGSSTTVVK
jgi:hypothetical protein